VLILLLEVAAILHGILVVELQSSDTLLHWIYVILLVLLLCPQCDFLACQVLVVDLSQEFLFEERVEFEVEPVGHQLHLCLCTVGKVKTLAFFVSGVSDNTVSAVGQRLFVFLAHINIHVFGESAPVFVLFFQFFSALDDVVLAAFVFPCFPCADWRVKLAVDCSVLVDLIDSDEFSAILVELLDFCESGIEGSLQRPVDVKDTTESAQLQYHILQLTLFL